MISLRLSKAGYGSPESILQWDTMNVMAALDYEKFLIEYDSEFRIINKVTT